MELSLNTILILFGVGAIAGFINTNAGGGSTLTLPALIFAGLDTATANGTNRIAILLQNMSGVASFRNQKVYGLRLALMYGLFTIPGAIAGAFFSIKLSDIWFQRILGIIMIAIVLSLIVSPQRKTGAGQEVKNPGWGFYLSLLGVGFYGGFIQVGVGFVLMAALFGFLKTSLVRVNFYKLTIVFVYTIPTLAFFVLTGNVDWPAGLSLATGNIAGAWIGAHMSVKKGDAFIRYVLIVTILILAAKLLMG